MVTKESNDLMIEKSLQITLLIAEINDLCVKENVCKTARDHLFKTTKELHKFATLMQIESGELESE